MLTLETGDWLTGPSTAAHTRHSQSLAVIYYNETLKIMPLKQCSQRLAFGTCRRWCHSSLEHRVAPAKVISAPSRLKSCWFTMRFDFDLVLPSLRYLSAFLTQGTHPPSSSFETSHSHSRLIRFQTSFSFIFRPFTGIVCTLVVLLQP